MLNVNSSVFCCGHTSLFENFCIRWMSMTHSCNVFCRCAEFHCNNCFSDHVSPEDAEAIRDRVRAWLSAIGAGRFEPTPGEHCRWCDFLSFCDPGKAFVGQTRT